MPRFVALILLVTTPLLGQQPTPSFGNIHGCGIIRIHLNATVSVAVEPHAQCGDLVPALITLNDISLAEGAPSWTAAGGVLRVTLAIHNNGRPVRLPLHILVSNDSLKAFGNTQRGGTAGFPLWDNADGPESTILEAIDSYRERLWTFRASDLDSLAIGVLGRDSTSATRTIRLNVAPSVDSILIPYRVRALLPAAPIPSPGLLPPFSSVTPRLPAITDTTVFPLPFSPGYAVVGFADRTLNLHRQLVFDRLGAEAIAEQRRPGGIDYLVHLSPAWSDSLVQLHPRRQVERGPDRFGLLVHDPSPAAATCARRSATEHVVKTHTSERADNSKVRWREAWVFLASPSEEERRQVCRLTLGYWVSRGGVTRPALMHLRGTAAAVEATLGKLELLPQVEAAGLDWSVEWTD